MLTYCSSNYTTGQHPSWFIVELLLTLSLTLQVSSTAIKDAKLIKVEHTTELHLQEAFIQCQH